MDLILDPGRSTCRGTKEPDAATIEPVLEPGNLQPLSPHAAATEVCMPRGLCPTTGEVTNEKPAHTVGKEMMKLQNLTVT